MDIDEIRVIISGDASDLEKTIRGVEKELEGLEKAQKGVSSATQEATKSEQAYGDTISQTDDKISDYTQKTQKQTQEQKKQTQENNRQKRSLESIGKSYTDLGKGIDQVAKPIYAASTGLAIGGVAAAKFAIDFEDSFAGVKKTVEGTPEQLDKIKQDIIDMSTVGINGHNAIPLTTKELNELAAAGGQLGIQTENIANFTETMAMMETATNLSGEQGAATLARYMNVMQVGQDQISNIGSTIVDLGNNSATTEAEIAEMALRMGKFGNTVGMGAADVLGYSAALSSMGVEAQAGGSAVGRTWLAIEEAVASGGKDLQAFAKYSGMSAKEFQKQWSTDPKGAFNGLLKGLQAADNLTLALDEIGVDNTLDKTAMQALVNGFDLVEKSVDRANKAYKENTALQNEFNAKSETTASQLAVTKNNIVEAARSFGEVMLPTLKDVTGGVAGFAKGLAGMSDSGKKTVMGVAGGVIALGAATKGLSGGIKFIGNTADGLSKIKTAFSAGGVFAKFAPTLMSIASATGPVALGVAGIGAAALIAKKSYDAWYNSQYRWSEGLSEGNAKIQESLGKYKQLSSIQGEIKDLKLVIENPESSQEQVETAKSRLEEIKKLLSEEYNLVINSDNSNLDDVVENLKTRSKNELQRDINTEISKMNDLQDKALNFKNSRTEIEASLKAADDAYTKFDTLQTKLDTLNAKYKPDTEEYTKGLIEIGEALGYTEEQVRNGWATIGRDIAAGLADSKKEFEDLDSKYRDSLAAYNEWVAIATSTSNMLTEVLQTAAAEGDAETVTNSLQQMGEYIRLAGLDLEGYAQAAALAMNGVDSLETAWQQAGEGKGDALNGVVKDYIRSMQEFGATATETATGAALIQNGFRTIGDAVKQGAINEVVDDFVAKGKELGMSSEQIATQASVLKQGFSTFKEAADSGALDVVIEQANELYKSLDNIPEGKHIDISASGDISIIDDATNRVEELQLSDGTTIKVTATGDVQMLDEAGNQVAYLERIGAVTLRINTETGDIEALDNVGNVVANLSKQGQNDVNINVTATTDDAKSIIQDLNNEPVEVKVGADPSPAQETINGLNGQTITVTVQANVVGMPEATGTQNFPGGFAMVNDQKGISDPRELIVDKGRAFIPEGRDVILPLSKGAKVYTAKQTKAIMERMGIPHYAGGKDNSEGFTNARDEWQHYTRTHAVTTSEELEKWVELSGKYKSNQKDVWDIQEQIFSLTQKQTQELNKASKAWVSDRSALNDWDEYGDSAVDAFERIRERNFAEVEAQRMTWSEFTDTMSDMGQTMYDARFRQSEKWLAHEEKYNGMSTDDYLAGIDRMRAYTEEYYQKGIISHREYVEKKIELDEKYTDKFREGLDKQLEASMKFADEHTYFNDWNEITGLVESDNPFKAFEAVRSREIQAVNEGKQLWEDAQKHISDFGSALFQGRFSQSKRWLDEQVKYFDMSDEEYIDGLKRMQKYTQEYLDAGIIGRKEYNEAMTEINHMLWDKQEEMVTDALQKQREAIDQMRQEFSDQEQAIRDSWTVADRRDSIADLTEKVRLYTGAVTERGKEQLKQYQEQLKQAQREEELYQLQQKNNAVIEDMEKQYKLTEDNKKVILRGIRTDIVDAQSAVNTLVGSVENQNNNTEKLLKDIKNAINNVNVRGNTTNYIDSRTQTTTNYNSTPLPAIGSIAFGNWNVSFG